MKTIQINTKELDISNDNRNYPSMIGVNTDFKAVFNTDAQRYDVFYKGKFLASGYKYSDIKSYLD